MKKTVTEISWDPISTVKGTYRHFVQKEIHEQALMVACGTSAYSGLMGKFMIEHLARVPVKVGYGSELRYRATIINGHILILAITQSGETVDTLAAVKEVADEGAKVGQHRQSHRQQGLVCQRWLHPDAGWARDR